MIHYPPITTPDIAIQVSASDVRETPSFRKVQVALLGDFFTASAWLSATELRSLRDTLSAALDEIEVTV